MTDSTSITLSPADQQPEVIAEPPLLQLRNRSLHYGNQTVLCDISLTIRAGEKVALVGPSGAGKSSLLVVLHELAPALTALCPQNGGLVEVLSVYQNMFMGGLQRYGTLASLWNLVRPLPSAVAELESLAARLGLDEKLWNSVDRLSGGQRQRVTIGRALFRRQPLLLADEPVSALDPLQATSLLTYLLEQHQTAVVSLHNRQLALELFDRVVVMHNGKILHDGPSAELSPEQLDELYRYQES
ncbi:ATP-binding cassette domain-containing protein [Parathalassolituus penaei]|uniref:ATP-binding cassette domain-containing protein n=1 Tax=Parathalassolituus penaei TaxID=2997323 RepID=A0A9X3ITP1_9GAMM|nr:ATP-binding cassette domain-containing protein [Parathalassolituus penaei]MCY0967101.1 ATP-binding cassette domain-containing protein [Parathalassolituus penaei]